MHVKASRHWMFMPHMFTQVQAPVDHVGAGDFDQHRRKMTFAETVGITGRCIGERPRSNKTVHLDMSLC